MCFYHQLNPERIIVNIAATDQDEFLAVAADYIGRLCPDVNGSTVHNALLERERLGTTATGHQVAIPHCKMKKLQRAELFIFTTAEPLDFKSADGSMTQLFFVLLSPQHMVREHLQILAQISRVARKAALVQSLIRSCSGQQLLELLQSELE
ncbi:PTS sugar transporter subunit IIA [Desulfurispira natronophila]|uniref:PTS system nitrogen regulatory IIA component n=1 Tax=Desulfurispira natronophila TaxID=682562 RepID=A0A7W8DG98_9BACT|nr:PTS sugar transporter subunit IIA [Desulfurispira natronophila]MBB5021003.1 PTS system nitrogen regulatory IIA component [Desulfurispira natronophila]